MHIHVVGKEPGFSDKPAHLHSTKVDMLDIEVHTRLHVTGHQGIMYSHILASNNAYFA